MCCFQTLPLGNIFNQTLQEIWQNNITIKIRKSTKKGQLHKNCSSWTACPFVYKPLNMFDIPDLPYPTEIEFDLPNFHCNIGGTNPNDDNPACIMCARSHNYIPEPDHTDVILRNIKPFLSNLNELFVGGVAEPFWKDKIFDILDKLEFNHKTKLKTVTNGTILTEITIDKFIRLCPNFELHISIDAACPETYIKIRRIDAYNKIIQNIRYICKNKSKSQIVEIHNNINLLNVHEMVRMVQIASDLGVDLISFNPTHDPGYGHGHAGALDAIIMNKSNWKIFDEEYKKALQEANRLNLNMITYKDFNIKPKTPNLVQINKLY